MQNLKSKYEQQGMQVSDGLWDRLEEKLDQVPAKKAKPKMIWWKFVAVIILILNFGEISWMTEIQNKVKQVTGFEPKINNNQTLTENRPAGSKNRIEMPDAIKSIDIDNSKLVAENLKDASTLPRITNSRKNKNQTNNLIPEKEIIIEEPQNVSQKKPEIAQTEMPKARVKYVSSSDLLFGVEIDKAKLETPKSAMGINTPKIKNESDFPSPKRIKLFGITLYDKDSTTTK